jgi:hypothetical protein
MDVRVIQAEDEAPVAAPGSAVSLTAEVEEERWDGAAEAQKAGLPSGAILNADGTVALTLRYPLHVAVGSQTTPYEDILFGRLKGKHMKDLIKCGMDDFLPRAMWHSTGLSQPRCSLLLDEMDASDQGAVGAVIRFLSGSGVRTGR